jgi:hypothetical protein
MIDLNEWHRAIHRVTGAMALRFNKATAADLAQGGAMRLPLEKTPRQSDSLGFQKYRSNGHYCRLAEQTARG